MKKPTLKRRELERLLRQNGFERAHRRGSHEIWRGRIDNRERIVAVDAAIGDYAASTFNSLYFIVLAQLGFFREDLGSDVAWERFYGGDAEIANRAGVKHRRWDDPGWQELYGRNIGTAAEDGPFDLLELNVFLEISPSAQASLRKLSKSVLGGIARILRDTIAAGMRVTAVAVDEVEDTELENWRQLIFTLKTPLSPEAAFPYWEQASQALSLLREHLDVKDQEILDTYITLEVEMEHPIGV